MHDADKIAMRQDKGALISALQEAGARQQGNMFFCFAHEDGKKPNLSVYQTEEGAWKAKCHSANCNWQGDIFDVKAVAARKPVGEVLKDMGNGAHTKTTTAYSSLTALTEAALRAAKRETEDYQLTETNEYTNPETGNIDLVTFRFENLDGKCFRQGHQASDGFHLEAGPKPWPLFNRKRMKDATVVFVVEGEKCVRELTKYGFVATTAPCGARKSKYADWTPLKGKKVYLWPDNDPVDAKTKISGGIEHMKEIAAQLHELNSTTEVYWIDPAFHHLGPKEDVVECLRDCGATTDEQRIAFLKDAVLANAKLYEFPPEAPQENSHLQKKEAVDEPILIQMSEVVSAPLRWLWPNRVPLGKLTLFAGDPGLGKSFMTLDMAARVSTGTPWPDSIEPTEVGNVIILSAEDDPADTIKPRLEALGANMDRITLLDGVKRAKGIGYFSLEGDLPVLERAIHKTPGLRLIVLDPVSAYLGGTDSHKNAEVRGLLAPLCSLAARYGVSATCVTHLNKSVTGKALFRAMGSLAFAAAARAAWLIAKDENDEQRRLFLPIKMNLASEPTGLAYRIEGSPAKIEWERDAISQTADEALGSEHRPQGWQRDSCVEWLKNVLSGEPVPVTELKELAKSAGFASWHTIERARESAGIKVHKTGFGIGGMWVWELKKPMPKIPQ